MFRSRYKANSRYVSIEARNDNLQFSSSFIARGADASAFQSCPRDPTIRSRYKNGKDPMPSSRYKKRTGDPSPLESSPEGETDRCVLESDGRLLI